MNQTPAPAQIRAPRTITREHMHQHLDNGRATILSTQPRYRMFVRYDNTWWIANADGFCEIVNDDHNRKLDTWRRRLTEGALWA